MGKVIEFDPARRYLREVVEAIKGAPTDTGIELLQLFQSTARAEGHLEATLEDIRETIKRTT